MSLAQDRGGWYKLRKVIPRAGSIRDVDDNDDEQVLKVNILITTSRKEASIQE